MTNAWVVAPCVVNRVGDRGHVGNDAETLHVGIAVLVAVANVARTGTIAPSRRGPQYVGPPKAIAGQLALKRPNRRECRSAGP